MMTEAIFITRDGSFEIDGHPYRIPEHFTTRQVLSYRSLLAPVPDKRGGTVLPAERRKATEEFLYRRAAACVIPEFGLNAPPSMSRDQLTSIHRWIGRNRPELSSDPGPPRR